MDAREFQERLKVEQLDLSLAPDIQHEIDIKLKPVGSLGKLESLALQLKLICGDEIIRQPQLFVFAAEHGIADQGVSVGPKEMTSMLVAQAVAGKCAINSLCEVHQIQLHVVNAGLYCAYELNEVIQQPVALGTHDFSLRAAMSQEQAQEAILLGHSLIQHHIEQGCDCVLLGEMGIGNTTSAAALMAALTPYQPSECVGPGAGVVEEIVEKKAILIEKALNRIDLRADTLTVLSEVGGFEIAQMVGAIIGAAQKGVPIVIDGFICSAAALVAVNLSSQCLDFMIFSHWSNEKGHKKMLDMLDADPLLNLGFRLGEGTGAAMAMPLIRSAQAFYQRMGTLEDVGLVGVRG